MQTVIQNIIQNQIPTGHIFDAHAIIAYMFHNGSYEQYHRDGWDRRDYHREISKAIAELERDGVIEDMGNSWSQRLNGEFGENKCWQKL
jgi:hypothetical protein